MNHRIRLPAEWEPQSGVMLTWPHDWTDWADQLDRAEAVMVAIATAITRDERLVCVARDETHRRHIDQQLQMAGIPSGRVCWATAPSNDSWARDHGPLTTLDRNGKAELHDFRFDGWGRKFPADLDDTITAALHQQYAFDDSPLRTHRLVLEGGAVETDGAGTLLATRSSVLDPTRNPGWSTAEIEEYLRDNLGFDRLLWLDHGELTGDDTDAHIDVLARFADAQTIVHSTAPPGDADHASLTAMAGQLAGFRDRSGRPYRLIPLPFPGVHLDDGGRRLPASYANFLITNHSVLLPVYGVEADAEAIHILAACFPTRRVVPIDCRPIIRQNGSLHCLTMQFPQAVPLCRQDPLEIAR
ncbi:MAG: agmatine deiminase family protein [Gammaproteobacteria bacterium]|nr:MAG: agmatine deiminase family protein [Gammaproteobacteria bacterium]